MRTFEKLKIRIKKDLDIDLINFKRAYVGYWQKASGAWVWIAERVFEDGRKDIYDYGSSFTATELLKEKEPLTILSKEIMPST